MSKLCDIFEKFNSIVAMPCIHKRPPSPDWLIGCLDRRDLLGWPFVLGRLAPGKSRIRNAPLEMTPKKIAAPFASARERLNSYTQIGSPLAFGESLRDHRFFSGRS